MFHTKCYGLNCVLPNRVCRRHNHNVTVFGDRTYKEEQLYEFISGGGGGGRGSSRIHVPVKDTRVPSLRAPRGKAL